MKDKIKKMLLPIFGFFMMSLAALVSVVPTFATVGISLSPMSQKIVLTPGETYTGSFLVRNGASNDEDLSFTVSVDPFSVDENYEYNYEENNKYNKMAEWVTLDKTEGTLSPNEQMQINYTVKVPMNAPAGGQYVAIRVTSVNNEGNLDNAPNIKVKYAMAYLIYAEIAGTTVRQGEITNMDMPGFLFSGNLSATSTVRNAGNVHGEAKYKLQVFPLFSDEEVYTNEEDPETRIILPERSLTSTSTWEDTPQIGIFNVVYTVEFEGVTNQLKKMVIVCPIWLLVIVIAVVVLLIFYFASRAKKKNKK